MRVPSCLLHIVRRPTVAASTVWRPSPCTSRAWGSFPLQLLETIARHDRGVTATDADKKEVDELARQLEARNPNKKALASPLLAGKWELLYTTSDSILGTSRPPFLRPNGPIHQFLGAHLRSCCSSSRMYYCTSVKHVAQPPFLLRNNLSCATHLFTEQHFA